MSKYAVKINPETIEAREKLKRLIFQINLYEASLKYWDKDRIYGEPLIFDGAKPKGGENE